MKHSTTPIRYSQFSGASAVREYLPAMGDLYEEGFSKLVWHSFCQDILEKPDLRLFAAFAGAEMVGMRLGYARSTTRFYVWFLIVRRDHQRRGIGRKLIELGNDHLAREGYREVLANSPREDFPAVGSLVEKAGYGRRGSEIWTRIST